MTEELKNTPISFLIAKWYGFIFAGMYILYGGVQIILGFMDNKYDDTMKSVLFLVLGLGLITVVYAYRDLKLWGWYGMIGINALAMLLLLPTLPEIVSLILFLLSGATIVLLIMPATKAHIHS